MFRCDMCIYIYIYIESSPKCRQTSYKGGMQGGHYGSCDDIGIYGCVDAVRCISTTDRVR